MIFATVIITCGVMAFTATRLGHWAVAAVCSVLLICILSPAVWLQGLQGYPQDSYWTLGLAGRVGVLAISLVGISAFYGLLWVAIRRFSARTRLVLTVVCGGFGFVLLQALAPQAFYAFYRFIFPDLPQQWVVGHVFDLDQLRALASMPKGGSLSDHLAGMAFWAVCPFAVWAHKRG
jgi:hypothetical protein